MKTPTPSEKVKREVSPATAKKVLMDRVLFNLDDESIKTQGMSDDELIDVLPKEYHKKEKK